MDLSIQTMWLNVGNLRESIEFYRDVLDLRVLSQQDRIAILVINEGERSQILLLREVGRNAHHSGRGAVGSRVVAFEAGSPEDLDVIEKRLAQRQALVGHARTDTYRGIIGRDPDQIEIAVSSGLTGGPVRIEDWATINDAVYAIE
jgi:catechol-2,3-dioxygenase